MLARVQSGSLSSPRRRAKANPRKNKFALFAPKGVDYLHPFDVEGLQPMTTKSSYQNRIEILQGTLDMLILKTLQWGEQHGYGISQAIRASSGEVLQVETGSLYPALHRLERQGWVKAEWKKSESNQRAKFYKITKLGKEQLASDYERWGKMVATIEGIMTAK
jgi:transcriptional regulator